MWRKFNKEQQEEMGMVSVISFVRGQKIQWLGHVKMIKVEQS